MKIQDAPVTEAQLRDEHRRLRMSCPLEDALASPCLRRILEASARARLFPRVPKSRPRFDWKRAQAGDLD